MTTEQDRVPLLLDTDIGSDIDDAVCLAYLLKQPRCELLGITTVTGEPDKRAMLCEMLCSAAGRTDIPIHSGAADPILRKSLQPNARQAEVLKSRPHLGHYEPNTAVDFLRGTIKSRPGEITLLAIGPMTNVGLLFALDPEIPCLLKRLVMMIGVFKDPPKATEWNATNDPHAAAIVYGAPVSDHLSIGLDVTRQCRMSSADCRERFRGDVLNGVMSLAEVWFRQHEQITFHDPLAAAVIFDPQICGYEHGQVNVEMCDGEAMGATMWSSEAKEKPHTIATTVDAGRFFGHYFDIAGRV